DGVADHDLGVPDSAAGPVIAVDDLAVERLLHERDDLGRAGHDEAGRDRVMAFGALELDHGCPPARGGYARGGVRPAFVSPRTWLVVEPDGRTRTSPWACHRGGPLL